MIIGPSLGPLSEAGENRGPSEGVREAYIGTRWAGVKGARNDDGVDVMRSAQGHDAPGREARLLTAGAFFD